MHDVMEFIGHFTNCGSAYKLFALISCEKLYIKSQFIVENILKGMNGNFHVFFFFLFLCQLTSIFQFPHAVPKKSFFEKQRKRL
jgi:hypothetical protein